MIYNARFFFLPFLPFCLVNREIAFVQAIISAGIVHTVTQNCSAGGSDHCKCTTAYMTTGNGNDEHTTRSNFRWAGCTDNVELGYKMAIAYLDERESGRDLKAKIRLHNHQVGRMVNEFLFFRNKIITFTLF